MNQQLFWTLILLAGAGTFLLRFSFLALAGGEVAPLARRILRLVPAAALAALVAPAVLSPGTAAVAGDPLWIRPLAALAAVLVARRTGSILATLATGMAVLWAMLGLT